MGDIKKALEHCVKSNCVGCPNNEELGSGEIVCRGRLLSKVLEYINELENQLAEKEKEIEYFKKQAHKFNNEAQKYYEDAYCNDFHNQDKISFAIEQLEKIKENLIDGLYDLYSKPSKIYEKYGDLFGCAVIGQIDTIIKSKIKNLRI